MNPSEKYEKQYFMPPVVTYDWVKKDDIDHAPIWCSVDLRDGNQALVEPMSLDEKIEFFKMLVEIGFKEIEIGFPAASETEYQFCRTLIEQNLIPADVTIQVLTQAREHIIKKTFAAIKGAPRAVVHVYNSTSVAQREQVFKKDKEHVKQIAIDGAALLKELADKTDGNFTFEYSPESFTGTEMDYALEVCNAVLDVWQPTPDNKVIINLPATVENAMPHVFATQIEYMNKNMKYRDGVVLSLHPHNDRGCGVAAAELGLLAGADRTQNHRVKLEYLQVTSGVGVRSVASLGLNISGEKFEAAASGNGPVDAAIKALKKIIDRHMTLKEFTIQAISKGSDDMGKVHMQVEYDNHIYYGFGANTDIIAASVEAYIDCINKFKS